MGNDVRRLEYSQSDPIEGTTLQRLREHLPVVFLQFVNRVGVWPRVLVSDGAD